MEGSSRLRQYGFGEYEDESREPEIFHEILGRLERCIDKLQSGKLKIEWKDSAKQSGRQMHVEKGEGVLDSVDMRSLNSVSIPDSYMVKRF